MDKTLSPLETHFDVPPIERVEVLRPLRWIKLGWMDLMDAPGASFGYGLILGGIGAFLLWLESEHSYLLPASLSCYLLVAPLLAVGVYEISRRRELGQSTTFAQSIDGWRRNASSVGLFGVALMLVAIFWERSSAILFALLSGSQAPDLNHFLANVVLSGRYLPLVITWFLSGAALATLVFTLSAVSLPMMMDRGTDPVTAMMTSVKAVASNPVTMAVWAGLIVALVVVIGFATLMIGMIVVTPLLGNATWHAYRDLVRKAA
jgi:uncharacterized membrane protein